LHGNDDAYFALLNHFRATQGGVLSELHAALAARQVERARRLAHNLEGQAANLGALALADAAGRVRTAIDLGDCAEREIAPASSFYGL
jgi:HPt (histidine-containing phosphotransfer) domain-containing protein